jgi:TonB family protein
MKICLPICAAIAGAAFASAQENLPVTAPNSKPSVATKVSADTHLCQWPSGQILSSAVKLTVDKDGNPQHVSLAHSSGNSCLDEAALTATRAYRFRPATNKRGDPVASNISLLVDFEKRTAARADAGSNPENPPATGTADSGRQQTTLAGTRIYPISGGGKPPRPLYTPDPQYSSGLPRGNGVVLVGLVVTEQGTPENVRILNSSNEGLENAALDAVRGYRFAPATLDGKPVAVKLQVKVDFSIHQ